MDGSRCHSEFFFLGKSSQNSPKPVLIFWSTYTKNVYSVCIHRYFFLVIMIRVFCPGFPKKVWMGGG